jgi:hypothetical protein
MWLARQTPQLARTLKRNGLTLDPATLADLQKAPMNAIVSSGGCSAAFLIPQGLVVTNHHCVYGSVQYNSKPGQDYLTNGSVAASLSDELPAAPGTRVYVIERRWVAKVDRALARQRGTVPPPGGQLADQRCHRGIVAELIMVVDVPHSRARSRTPVAPPG